MHEFIDMLKSSTSNMANGLITRDCSILCIIGGKIHSVTVTCVVVSNVQKLVREHTATDFSNIKIPMKSYRIFRHADLGCLSF